MRKILLFITLILSLSACSDKLDFTYHDFQVVVEGDLETPFLKSGETRSIKVSFQQQKYANDRPTGSWVSVPVTVVKIYDESGQFEISNRRFSGNDLLFDLIARENETQETVYAQIGFFLEDEVYLDSDAAYIIQEAGEISREYRVTTETNPLIIPSQGIAEYDIPFMVECRLTINGVPREWKSENLYGLLYRNNCWGAASHHTLEIKQGKDPGQFYFHITARPYYLEEEGNWMRWSCSIYSTFLDGWEFTQEFQHGQDRSLAGTQPPATGNDFSGGYLYTDRE